MTTSVNRKVELYVGTRPSILAGTTVRKADPPAFPANIQAVIAHTSSEHRANNVLNLAPAFAARTAKEVRMFCLSQDRAVGIVIELQVL